MEMKEVLNTMLWTVIFFIFNIEYANWCPNGELLLVRTPFFIFFI